MVQNTWFSAGKQGPHPPETKGSHSPLLSLWQGSQIQGITVIVVVIIIIITLYENTGNCYSFETMVSSGSLEKEQKKNEMSPSQVDPPNS